MIPLPNATLNKELSNDDYLGIFYGESIDDVYSKIEKDPNLLTSSANQWGQSVFSCFINRIAYDLNIGDPSKGLDLLCKLIELNPQLNLNTSSEKVDPSKIYFAVLSCKDCESKTKLLKYLLLLGLEIPKNFPKKQKLEELTTSMKKEIFEVLASFKEKHTEELPLFFASSNDLDHEIVQYKFLIGI